MSRTWPRPGTTTPTQALCHRPSQAQHAIYLWSAIAGSPVVCYMGSHMGSQVVSQVGGQMVSQVDGHLVTPMGSQMVSHHKGEALNNRRDSKEAHPTSSSEI
jgi:hypothetical protein